MARRTVDLSQHINLDVVRGHPADFPVGLVRVFREREGVFEQIPRRLAVVRPDTGSVLSVVSDRYQLVPHQQILDAVQEATRPLDVGPVPRGIYVDRGGARMRAIFKFPALARPILGTDTICPCVTIENSYDAKSRIAIHIGAFRFVCTNLAVGGGGVFAGGFVSLHAGEVRIAAVAEQFATFLAGFEGIVQTYHRWYEAPISDAYVQVALFALPMRAKAEIQHRIQAAGARSAFEGYNVATAFAMHEMRSAAAAFSLLGLANRGFQDAARHRLADGAKPRELTRAAIPT